MQIAQIQAYSYECTPCSDAISGPKNRVFDIKSGHDFCRYRNSIQLIYFQISEEMLIARALPIMRVYIKPGGQRGYSGHCINLPQNVTELATCLPRYPKELAVIIVKVKGKDNTFKDVTVRKQKVYNALVWLMNNSHYSDVKVNENALDSLPENGIPPDLVMADHYMVSDDSLPDTGPPTDNPSEDIVYNDSTEMSSFLHLLVNSNNRKLQLLEISFPKISQCNGLQLKTSL